jgi:DNA polymerase III sliding clamp (beta) subunit (PCNA family)
VEFPESAAVDIVLPIKAVQELQRSLSNYDENVSIKVQSSQISFNIGNIILYSKLIVDKYPNYTQVIPQEDGEQVIIDRQLLINAVERASVMTLDESHSVKLVFEGNRLTIMSATSDFGEAKDEIPVKYAGEKIEIVKYSDDPVAFISEALSPAKVVSVEILSEDPKTCRVTVPDSQLSLAIGNKGQNVRLAARLTGWKIDIRPESGYFGEDEE